MKSQIMQEAAERFVIDVTLYLSKKKGGLQARQDLEKKLLWHYGHYVGPYPLFWSGLMQQGNPHHGFEKWLHACGDRALQQEWKKISFSFL